MKQYREYVSCLLVNWFEQVSWKLEIERWKGKDEHEKLKDGHGDEDGRGNMENPRWKMNHET